MSFLAALRREEREDDPRSVGWPTGGEGDGGAADRLVVRDVPVIPYGNRVNGELFSPTVGCRSSRLSAMASTLLPYVGVNAPSRDATNLGRADEIQRAAHRVRPLTPPAARSKLVPYRGGKKCMYRTPPLRQKRRHWRWRPGVPRTHRRPIRTWCAAACLQTEPDVDSGRGVPS
jgi:hypothetical protein